MSYRNVGVDLSVTAKHKAKVIDENGNKIVPNFSFHFSKENLDALCRRALECAEQGTKLRFICEPTGMSWFPLALYAKDNNHEAVRVKAHKAHDLRKYFSRHKKNDSLDAEVLATMPRIDKKAIEEVYLPNACVFSLERRNKQADRVIKEIATIKNRLSSLFHWVMPGLLDCFEDPFSSRAREFYRHFCNPFRAKESGIEGISQVLKSAGRQQIEQDLPGKLYTVACNACELYANASDYIDFVEMQDEVRIELQLLESQEEALTHVKSRTNDLYEKAHPSKNIESLRGVGPNLAASFIGLIGDPERFSSQSRLRSYAGMIPKQDASGESDKQGLSLSKEGPSRLRQDLFLSSDVARHWDPQLAKVYYNEMVYKGHCHTQAICAVMGRLSNRILCILKENRPYELRDLDGNPISKKEARKLVEAQFIVPEEVRQRLRKRRDPGKKREERFHNRFKRQPTAPHDFCGTSLPQNILVNPEKTFKDNFVPAFCD